MNNVLIDTHVWAWSATTDELLSSAARAAISGAHNVYLSPASLYEVSQKVRLGKWNAMIPVIDRIWQVIEDLGTTVIPLTPAICLDAGQSPWNHRDPFDRLIVATARALDLPLITADRVMASAPGIRTIW